MLASNRILSCPKCITEGPFKVCLQVSDNLIYDLHFNILNLKCYLIFLLPLHHIFYNIKFHHPYIIPFAQFIHILMGFKVIFYYLFMISASLANMIYNLRLLSIVASLLYQLETFWHSPTLVENFFLTAFLLTNLSSHSLPCIRPMYCCHSSIVNLIYNIFYR